jgi:hypothetical protein
MRTVVVALATIAVLASPAYAQGKGKGGKNPNPQAEQLAEERRKDAVETEKAYRAAIERIPDKDKKSYDPWGNMR